MTLTAPQRRLLEFISGYVASNGGVGPSFEDMQGAMGFGSKSSVHRLLQGLEERGMIRRLRHRSRAIEVLNGKHRCPHCGGDLA